MVDAPHPCKPIPIPIPCMRRGGTVVHYVFWLFSGGAPARQPAWGGGGFQSLPASRPRRGAASFGHNGSTTMGCCYLLPTHTPKCTWMSWDIHPKKGLFPSYVTQVTPPLPHLCVMLLKNGWQPRKNSWHRVKSVTQGMVSIAPPALLLESHKAPGNNPERRHKNTCMETLYLVHCLLPGFVNIRVSLQL